MGGSFVSKADAKTRRIRFTAPVALGVASMAETLDVDVSPAYGASRKHAGKLYDRETLKGRATSLHLHDLKRPSQAYFPFGDI